MDTKTKVTRQGVRDLNSYGPRAGKATAGAPAGDAAPTDDQRIDEASQASSPASDSPPWPAGHEPRPAMGSDDADGGAHFERERRRLHID